MKMKIAKGMLYAGVIGLAIICLVAIIDTYNLAVVEGLTSTISCYNTESFDASLQEVKPIQRCDEYNPQFVFFGAMGLLVADIFLFHYFNRIIAQNAQVGRVFEKELKELNAEPNDTTTVSATASATTNKKRAKLEDDNKHEERQIEHKNKKMWI